MPADLITYGSDRRMVLANGEAIRAPIYLGTWNVIRIGLRGAFTGFSGNLSGTPRIAFGVCEGNLNGYSAALSDHVVGCRSQVATLIYSTVPNRVAPFGTNNEFIKKVGATVTSIGSGSGGGGLFSADSAVRNYVALQITKGSPNFSFSMTSINSSAECSVDVTDALFTQYMESGTLAPNANYLTKGPSVLAVNEGVDGTLDHIFIHWDRTAQQFGFDIKHRKES